MDPDLAAVVTAFAALAMIGYLAAVFGLVSSPVAWLALGLVIGWFAGGRSVGRYQVEAKNVNAYLVDTRTGKVWLLVSNLLVAVLDNGDSPAN